MLGIKGSLLSERGSAGKHSFLCGPFVYRQIQVKTLRQMFGPNGNPAASNLYEIVAHLQQAEGSRFCAPPRTSTASFGGQTKLLKNLTVSYDSTQDQLPCEFADSYGEGLDTRPINVRTQFCAETDDTDYKP